MVPLILGRFRWRDSSIAVLGLAILIMACIIKINYHYADPQNEYQYYLGCVLFYSITLVVEAAAMAIIAKTIPPYLAYGYWNAGMLGGCAELLGRTCGNVSFTIYSLFDPVYKNRAQPFFAYITDSVVTTLLFMATVVLYPKLSKHMEIEMFHDN